jgi:hypothetical protein
MYLVLKIVSGEEVIGVLAVENMVETHNLEYFELTDIFELTDPMWIVADREGSMKLRSATILAAENRLVFCPENVIAAYMPSQPLIEYYKTATGYTQKYTQVDIDKQIHLATEELAQATKDAEEFESNLTKFIAKASKVSIH